MAPLLGFRRLIYETVAHHENMRFSLRQVSCTWHSTSRNVMCVEQECDQKFLIHAASTHPQALTLLLKGLII